MLKKKKLQRYPVNLREGEHLMSLVFTTIDQKFHYPVMCKNTSIVRQVVKQYLYKEFPEYSKTNNYFLCNGNNIDLYKSFQENGIKDGDTLVLNKIDDDD